MRGPAPADRRRLMARDSTHSRLFWFVGSCGLTAVFLLEVMVSLGSIAAATHVKLAATTSVRAHLIVADAARPVRKSVIKARVVLADIPAVVPQPQPVDVHIARRAISIQSVPHSGHELLRRSAVTQPLAPTTPVAVQQTPPATIPSTPVVSSDPASYDYTSSNWAGYVATSGSYTAISGQWTVPRVTSDSLAGSADATWIGIGGVVSNDLIQTGTDDFAAGDGIIQSEAFYEVLPDAAVQITSMVVQPGDVMNATISDMRGNLWSVSIIDETKSESFTTNIYYLSSHSSAEWIEEDPSTGSGSQYPFDSYGSMAFTGASAVVGGQQTGLSDLGSRSIAMISNSGPTVVSAPTAITENDGFWVVDMSP